MNDPIAKYFGWEVQLTANPPDEEQRTVEGIVDESADPLRSQSSSTVDNIWTFGLLFVLIVVVVAFLFDTDLGS